MVISRHLNEIEFISEFDKQTNKVDDNLLFYCQQHPNTTLITNDVYLKIKAIIRGLNTKGYGGTSDYQGVRYFEVDLETDPYNEELSKILNEHQYEGMAENEYLIVLDKNTKQLADIFCNHNNVLEQVIPYEIRNKWINKIYPKNPEQRCLFNALQRRENTIIYAGGSFGTGKSFILNNYAISELERGKISKIVYVPNNSYTENTIDIGALPGELLEKITGQIGPLVDLVGIDQIRDWIKTEQLEVVPMGSIRGRSFQNAIIIVNEAQNLTEDHIKLLIARCGEGTRIFFDGDYKQADSAVFRNKNGLKLLLNLKDSPIYSKIFATVHLKTIERSLTAQASNFLDELTGGI